MKDFFDTVRLVPKMTINAITGQRNTLIGKYETTQSTKSMCTDLANELKARLKAEWKSSVRLGYQAYGDIL